MGDYVGNPSVATANFEIPVGEPQVYGVFAGDGASVAVKRVVDDCVNAAGQIFAIAAHDGIVDRFGVDGNFGCMVGVFGRVDELEMFGACGFPFDVALIPVETDGEGISAKQNYAKKDNQKHTCNLGILSCSTQFLVTKNRAIARTV